MLTFCQCVEELEGVAHMVGKIAEGKGVDPAVHVPEHVAWTVQRLCRFWATVQVAVEVTAMRFKEVPVENLDGVEQVADELGGRESR